MQYGQLGANKGGMPCTMCPHLGCQQSYLRTSVTPCPECEDGSLVLDPLSAPKWRLDCNKCSFLIYLPAISLSNSRSLGVKVFVVGPPECPK